MAEGQYEETRSNAERSSSTGLCEESTDNDIQRKNLGGDESSDDESEPFVVRTGTSNTRELQPQMQQYGAIGESDDQQAAGRGEACEGMRIIHLIPCIAFSIILVAVVIYSLTIIYNLLYEEHGGDANIIFVMILLFTFVLVAFLLFKAMGWYYKLCTTIIRSQDIH